MKQRKDQKGHRAMKKTEAIKKYANIAGKYLRTMTNGIVLTVGNSLIMQNFEDRIQII